MVDGKVDSTKCPECGGAELGMVKAVTGRFFVQCLGCLLRGLSGATHLEALEAWSSFAAPPSSLAPEAEVELTNIDFETMTPAGPEDSPKGRLEKLVKINATTFFLIAIEMTRAGEAVEPEYSLTMEFLLRAFEGNRFAEVEFDGRQYCLFMIPREY